MKLYFKNSQGKKRCIANVKTEDRAIEFIRQFCEERKFKIYYIRTWVVDNEKHFDVGSWSEHFVLKLEGNIDEQNE